MASRLSSNWISLPASTTDPTGVAGAMYFNSDINSIRFYDGTNWTYIINLEPDFDIAENTVLYDLYDSQRGGFSASFSDLASVLVGVITYSISAGTFPSGLTLNSDGSISGTPNAVSNDTEYTFTVRATANNISADRQFKIKVRAPVTVATFSYTGGWQSFNVPSTGSFTAHIWGAGGGGGDPGGWGYGFPGGPGGFTEVSVSASSGTTVHVLVGQGGWSYPEYSGGGGGLSGLFTSPTFNNQSLAIAIAGGGGGGGSSRSSTPIQAGGFGGGSSGGNGRAYYDNEASAGKGGTQSDPGAGGGGGLAGSGMYGGPPDERSSWVYAFGGAPRQNGSRFLGGGGGGGYYGGGGGDYEEEQEMAGGGGGSGYVGGASGFTVTSSNMITAPRATSNSQASAPNESSPYYGSGAGRGSVGQDYGHQSTGGHGRVVITY